MVPNVVMGDLWGVDMVTREGATVRLLIKVRPGAQWRVQRELRRRLKSTFDAAGLTATLAGQPAPVTFGTGEDDRPSASPTSGGRGPTAPTRAPTAEVDPEVTARALERDHPDGD